jgi:2-polyprenyl-3-methyl-5-hydroxy-6-metoxy-1,4-benzoquinol methylase
MATHPIVVDNEKISRILAEKRERGPAFPHIGVFVVTHNASHRLIETLRRIPPALLEAIEEVYIFDDSSTDDTVPLAAQLARSEPWAGKLRVFRNPRNYGYGGNQKIGFAYALERGLDFVILLHGDGRYAPEVLPDLIWPALFLGKEVVLGSRMLGPLKALKTGMPLVKWVGNLLLSRFQNLVLNMRLSEYHSGYRLYSTAVLRRIPFEENSDRFHFDTQVIIQCRALGAKIHEVPIPIYDSDEIRLLNGLAHAWNVCCDVVEYRLHQLHLVRRLRYVVNRGEKYKFKESPYSSHSYILSKVKPGSTVLDVGCGRGLLAKALARRGAHIVGADVLPAEEIAPEVAEYHRLDLERHEQLNLKRQFDCIILADVIEHLRNEEEILRHLKQFLKTDGRLLISTGNIAVWFYRLSLLLGRFNYGPRGILDRTHVKLYTRATFRQLIERCGYKVVRFDYTNLPFELAFESTARSRLLRAVDLFYHLLVRLWPTLFGYQFVAEAEVRALEAARGEGLVFGREVGQQVEDVPEGEAEEVTPVRLLVRAGLEGEAPAVSRPAAARGQALSRRDGPGVVVRGPMAAGPDSVQDRPPSRSESGQGEREC